MRILFIFISLFFVYSSSYAQELNAVVQVNSDRVVVTNQQIFKTLETAATEFLNNTKWTNIAVKPQERIDCSFFINVSAYGSDQFTATLQIQASRPIFNSTYGSPIFTFNDKDFSFRYLEFENLFFDPNSFDSNLVSVLAFYAYVILGYDADSYAPLAGTPYFTMAQNIANTAQQGNFRGWRQSDGNQTRFILITDLVTATFNPIRQALHEYHVRGLDMMADNAKAAKENIAKALNSLSKIHSVRPNAFVTRVFFDTKSDEIQSIFSGGPSVPIAELVDNLNRTSPTNAQKWSRIKM
jgi:hypothetical protein